jgi:hypothetical protein
MQSGVCRHDGGEDDVAWRRRAYRLASPLDGCKLRGDPGPAWIAVAAMEIVAT